MANHLWQSTLLVALVWLATLALRRHDARVRYWLWAAASVKFFLPFSWLIGLGAQIEWRAAPAIAQPAATFVMQEILLAPPLVQASVPHMPQDANAGSWVMWVVPGVWLAGTAVVLVWWARHWRPMRSALRSATPLRLGPGCDTTGLTVMSSRWAFEPGVVGILRPVLVLPEGLVDRLAPAQLDAILAHERAHIRAHDNLFAAVHMAVEAVFWFHPLVWWIERRLIDERERACDEAVVRAGKQPADYAEGILAVCRWSVESPVLCVSGVTGSNLRRRIETIMANRLGRRLRTTGRLLLACAALIVIGVPVGIGLLDAAEQTLAADRFEVATIRPNTTLVEGNLQSGGFQFRGGRFEATRVSLQELVTYAYDLRAFEVFGAPGWATSDRFDISATMPPPSTGIYDRETAARNRRLLRALLADRFNLVAHEERREMPVYALVAARADRKVGTRLRPFEGECGEPSTLGPPPESPTGVLPTSKGPQWCLAMTGRGRISARGTLLSDLAAILAPFPAVGRRVIDRTGLDGRFDFDLEWTPVVSGPPAPGAPVDRPDALPTLFTALQEQLGLKLEATRESMPVLIIDSVSQPSPN
jgi:uncharacterized protein (TIGR03435 family)